MRWLFALVLSSVSFRYRGRGWRNIGYLTAEIHKITGALKDALPLAAVIATGAPG